MAMWAGVQNVSRPMERCQEMSHWPPIMAEVTARTEHQTYQGTRSTAERTDVAGTEAIVVVVDAMLSLLYAIDYSFVRGVSACNPKAVRMEAPPDAGTTIIGPQVRHAGTHPGCAPASGSGTRAHRRAGAQGHFGPGQQGYGQARAGGPRTHWQAAQRRQAGARIRVRIAPAAVLPGSPRRPPECRMAGPHPARARAARGPSAPHHPPSN